MPTIIRRRCALAAACVLLLLLAATVMKRAIPGGAEATSSTSAVAAAKGPPARVALQVGHWRHEDLPAELRAVRRGGGGASADGFVEWRVGLAIAEEARRLLAARGVSVDLLPATVPPGYRADAFLSLHADGNPDPRVRGFKIAPAARSGGRRSAALSAAVARGYGARTSLPWSPALTSDMTEYYAFDARRFRHAVARGTPAAVLEMGFLTNAADRRVLVDAPRAAAEAISGALTEFLRREGRA